MMIWSKVSPVGAAVAYAGTRLSNERREISDRKSRSFVMPIFGFAGHFLVVVGFSDLGIQSKGQLCFSQEFGLEGHCRVNPPFWDVLGPPIGAVNPF